MKLDTSFDQQVRIPARNAVLEGVLSLPSGSRTVVLFAHGSGSSRHSPRNRFVADVLHSAGVGTLLFDLLTRAEDVVYDNRFDLDLLTDRLQAATSWLASRPGTADFSLGYFGASTGSAAALLAAAGPGSMVGAVVSRGGRPDLAGESIALVRAPVLLIVGGRDDVVIDLNRRAYQEIKAEKQLSIIPGATHLFEEPGALEAVSRLAADWFTRHLLD